jgi:hypothetical protein
VSNIYGDSSVVVVGAVTAKKVTEVYCVHHIGAYLTYNQTRGHLMCAREVEVMLEIQRFRKYSVERADNVLVPVPRLELMAESTIFAGLLLMC